MSGAKGHANPAPAARNKTQLKYKVQRRRRIMGVFGVVALVALIGGGVVLVVGGDDQTRTVSANYLNRAATATIELPSLRVSLALGVEGGGSVVKGQGSGSIVRTLGSPNRALLMTLDNVGQVEERLIDDVLYLRVGGGALALPPGKTWLRIEQAALEGASPELKKTIEGLLNEVGSTDPTAALEALSAVSRGVTNGERKQLRGGLATRYEATVDYSRLTPPVAGAARSTAASLFDALGSTLGRIPVSLWIDGKGRLVRYVVAFDPATTPNATAAQVLGRINVAFDFYDFDEAVTITPPAEGETIDGIDPLAQLSVK